MANKETVGVVGSGTMGHGIAQLFASSGIPVVLLDTSQSAIEKAAELIETNLRGMVEDKRLSKADMDEILGRITFTTEMEALTSASSYITEAVFEDLSLKQKVFKELDARTPASVIIASNSSSYDINAVAQEVQHKERTIGTHWFHPPQITPCVEVIPADKTSREVLDRTMSFLDSVGKAPTICKSAPGFVANRIQYAMVSEALAIVEEGLATPEQVDKIIRTSIGFRLSAYGPLEVCDQAGLDVYDTIFKYFYDVFHREVFKPPVMLTDMVKKGRHGLKNGRGFYSYESGAADRIRRERDRKLLDRLDLFRKENREDKEAT